MKEIWKPVNEAPSTTTRYVVEREEIHLDEIDLLYDVKQMATDLIDLGQRQNGSESVVYRTRWIDKESNPIVLRLTVKCERIEFVKEVKEES